MWIHLSFGCLYRRRLNKGLHDAVVEKQFSTAVGQEQGHAIGGKENCGQKQLECSKSFPAAQCKVKHE